MVYHNSASYLWIKGQTYYFNRRVPKDIQSYYSSSNDDCYQRQRMMNPVLFAAGVLVFGICAFDMMGILVRMLGGSYPILQIAVLRNLFGVLPALFCFGMQGSCPI